MYEKYLTVRKIETEIYYRLWTNICFLSKITEQNTKFTLLEN